MGKGKGERIDYILERIDASANAKREIEKDSQRAYRHLNSYLDEDRHPFPVKIYDPVFFGTQTSMCAKASDAIFTNPPVFDYAPRNHTDWEAVQIGTAVSNYYLDEAQPRSRIQDGWLGTTLNGTQFWYLGWDFEERLVYRWRPVIDEFGIITQKWLPELETVRDHPDLRPVHILNIFPDDLVTEIEKMEFIATRDYISDRECKRRARREKWTREAVAGALDGEISDRGQRTLSDSLDWLTEIGMRSQVAKNAILGEQHGERRRGVEVIEFWSRRKGAIWREVLLNRSYIAKSEASPFGDGEYPFLMSRNYSIDGQLWGLSDYRIAKYLIRGIQTYRNAAGSEALLAAMPPMLLPMGAIVSGKRWEPRAEWYLQGVQPDQIQFLQAGTTSRQIAHSEADMLQQRMDVALGTSDTARGSIGNARTAKATTVQLAFQSAGLRDKWKIENFAHDLLVPAGQKWRARIQQFGDRAIWIQLGQGRGGERIQIWPEDHRDLDLTSVPTSSVSILKAQKEKRVLELFNQLKGSPHINEHELVALVLETITPEYKEIVLRTMPEPGPGPDVPMPGPVPGPGPGEEGPGGDIGVPEMAGDLTDAYAQ